MRTAGEKNDIVLTVKGHVTRDLALSRADLSHFPRASIRAKDELGRESLFEGVLPARWQAAARMVTSISLTRRAPLFHALCREYQVRDANVCLVVLVPASCPECARGRCILSRWFFGSVSFERPGAKSCPVSFGRFAISAIGAFDGQLLFRKPGSRYQNLRGCAAHRSVERRGYRYRSYSQK